MLPVRSIDWSIPRVSPNAFRAGKRTPVEHVWLDVACIDQRANSPEIAGEIGRLTKIFKGANQTYVWLFKHDSAAVDPMHRAHDRDLGVRLIMKDYVDFLLSDPWFSSLWTLQEAHLRPDATLLTREGELWTTDGLPRDDYNTPAQLNSILTKIQATYVTVTSSVDSLALEHDRQHYKKLVVALERSDLLSMDFHCPTSMLAAAAFRQASRREYNILSLLFPDRVYGIMQVFDQRVGKSCPGADSKLDFSLGELEDELGAELNAVEPMFGQMHVYASWPTPGKGWRIKPESIPTASILLSYHYNVVKMTKVLLARMSTTILEDTGTTWGVFEGVRVLLARLHKAWLTMANGIRLAGYFYQVAIAIDCIQDYDELSVTFWRKNHALDAVCKVAEAHPNAVVLLLGHCIYIDAYTEAVGSIVVPYPSGDCIRGPVWRRVAVCSWILYLENFTLPFTDDVKLLLLGKWQFRAVLTTRRKGTDAIHQQMLLLREEVLDHNHPFRLVSIRNFTEALRPNP
ncbi:hypothetical protein HD806DRAFT_519340 [Xylariaceae sp. AK1471]|nr:hypothetical protein HD806DRAFT_519340 [Xylariaceae sp. AK1471]